MSQKLVITIDGKDGRVLPDSAALILHAVFGLARSLDERGWRVGTPRLRWRISEAKLVNPLIVSAESELAAPDSVEEPELASELVDSLLQIEGGIWPIGFGDRQMKLARMLAKESKRSRRLTISGGNGRMTEFTVGRAFSSRIRKLTRPAQTRTEYGSLEGALIGMVNDPLRDDGVARLRVGPQEGQEVSCHADPRIAADLAKYLDRHTRMVLYGDITYEGEAPKRIHVEGFTTVPGTLPTLADVHALRLRPPNGMSVEEYLDELRDDG